MIKDLNPDSVMNLGLELGLAFVRMKTILSSSSICAEMSNAWLMRYDEVSPNPTWRSLAEASAKIKCWGVVEKISQGEC